MNTVCRICSHAAGHRHVTCAEKMFGLGGAFPYFQCGQCGCLQITEVPPDLARFYPPHYYSFHLEPLPQRGFKSWLAARRDYAAATGRGWLGRWLGRRVPARIEVASLGRLPLRRDMRVLDVGCGRGQLLSILHRAGFRHLMGVDPYLPADVEVVPGLWVRRQALETVREQFDCIMLHHVFEHVEDGLGMLRACRDRLAPGGKLLLRLPTVECDAWDRYGVNWVQLDAPRHLFLHTRRSLDTLARAAGLRIADWWCDSTEFQFWVSELYVKGLPMVDAAGHSVSVLDHFTPEQVARFRAEAQRLNAAQRGDQMAVVLVAGDAT